MGTNKHDLFNLHRCKDHDTLLIVEGYPDAILFPTIGLDNVVAVGQGKLAKSHLEGLDEFGVRNVIISFDNDIASIENTTAAVRLLLKFSRINVFVIDPMWLTPFKDPDEYAMANGLDAFKNLVKDAESGAKLLANDIANKYDLTKDVEKQNALDDASEMLDDIISRILADRLHRRLLIN